MEPIKNKMLIGTVTVFVGIIFSIAMLNIFEPTKKTYFFERKFSNNEILKFERRYDKMDEGEYAMYLRSNNSIVERDKKIIDDKNTEYKFYFSDLSFKKKSTKTTILPNICNVIYCDTNRLFYTLKFKLFEYDFETKIIKDLGLNNLKAFSLKPILNSKNQYLCFGELFENNNYKTGFFVIDIENKNIVESKILEINKETAMPKNDLAYSGCFTENYDRSKIIYCCDKYSKIYFFNDKGEFTKELTTNDKSPLPQILKNSNGDSFYSRGATWTNNFGTFIKDDKIFVFSSRSDDKSSIIIDEYSYDKLKYKQSYKLNYNNLNSSSIRNVFIDKDKIIIGFEFNYASFTFSRYI